MSAVVNYEILAKYGNDSRVFSFSGESSLHYVSAHLQSAFDLATIRLVGLGKGKPAPHTTLAQLQLSQNNATKVMVVGSSRGSLDAISIRQDALMIREQLEADEKSRQAIRDAYEERLRLERQQRQIELDRIEFTAADSRRRVFDQERRRVTDLQDLDTTSEFQFSLSGFSSAFSTRTDIDTHRKLVLPATVLQQAVERNIAFPLIFRITRAQHSFDADYDLSVDINDELPSLCCYVLCSYAGVVDFTAPDSIVYIPDCVRQQLERNNDTNKNTNSSLSASTSSDSKWNEGEMLSIQSWRPPKGISATLLSESPEFMAMSESERRALLEQYLRLHPILVQGETFSINYHSRDYMLRVLRTRPTRCIAITDIDLALDMVYRPHEPVRDVLLPTIDGFASSSRLLGEAPGQTPHEFDYTKLPLCDLNQEYSVAILPGQTHTFRFRLESVLEPVRICLRWTAHSEADLYVAPTHACYHATTGRTVAPGRTNHIWCAQAGRTALCNMVELSDRDINCTEGEYMASCQAAEGNSLNNDSREFTFLIEPISTVALAHARTEITMDTQTSLCSNCQRRIPAASIGMHSLSCARLNYHCHDCQRTLPLSERAKHELMVHTPLFCACCESEVLSQAALPQHKLSNCMARRVACRFCPLRWSQLALFSHQQQCGGRLVRCGHCGQEMRAQAIRYHCQQQHGIASEDVLVDRDFS